MPLAQRSASTACACASASSRVSGFSAAPVTSRAAEAPSTPSAAASACQTKARAAVALLTTLYGALVANVVFGPILVKLESYTEEEATYREMVIEGLRGIARAESPRLIQEKMVSILPPKAQAKLMAA